MRMEAKTIESDRKSLQNASGKINQVRLVSLRVWAQHVF